MSTENLYEIMNSLPFVSHPGFHFNPEIVGYQNHTFGAKVGGEISLENFLHEVGHAIDFGPENFRYRSTFGKFRFKIRRSYSRHGAFEDFRKCTATLREIRAIVWQRIIAEELALPVDGKSMMRSFLDSLMWMPDELQVPGTSYIEKRNWRFQKAEEYLHSFDRRQALPRFVGWLDKIAAKEKRIRVKQKAV